jgi:hypothetical protein
MTIDREQMYGYTRPAPYTGSTRQGPVRRRFALVALTCTVLITALILVAGQALTGGF